LGDIVDSALEVKKTEIDAKIEFYSRHCIVEDGDTLLIYAGDVLRSIQFDVRRLCRARTAGEEE